MRFPTLFKRTDTTIGTDTVPVGPPNPSSMDNLLTSKFSNINGWPCSRIVVACTAPATASVMNSSLYFWEDGLQAWFALNSAAVALTPTTSAATGFLAYFDIVSLLDLPNTQVNLTAPGSGSISVALVVSAPTTKPVGNYTFAMAPDLTVKGT